MLFVAQERRREAAIIASQAVEVHETFKDLGGLVTAQGESLNKIEASVDTAAVTVVAANTDLVKAAAYQSSYRKKCCFLWALVLAAVIAVVVTLVVKFVPH